MGLPIDREQFAAAEYARFGERLSEQLGVLRELLARPSFGLGEPSLGAEVELHLVDAQAAPLAKNAEVLASAGDPRLTLEINRFNLEVNLRPAALAGRPFSALLDDLRDAMRVVREAAAPHGARPVLVGILPTLQMEQLAHGAISDAARYRALSSTLRDMRGEPFSVRIKGHESLSAECDDVALEGANASFQVHLRVTPRDFARTYNAAQLAAGPVLAACGNSPFFAGKWLWEETRIALFQQSVDTRVDAKERARLAARVSFGHGWVHDAYDCFAENVALHPALLPVCSDEDTRAKLAAGELPRLEELRLHHGTVWTWNRAVFDPEHGGHLRVEHRLLPSGPSAIDMVANAALTLGLTLGLSARMDVVRAIFPFAYAEQNLQHAARHGLSAQLFWPAERAPGPRVRNARELVLELLPVAEAGLCAAGVAKDEVRELLAIIEQRVQSGRTGAVVQRALLRDGDRQVALRELVERYLDHSLSELPVHRWPG
jgi:gamma-glutamyl:cysteine ligase YbdK (ATP-grasp superfamily)